MPPHVVVDEGAERQHRQAAVAGIVEGEGDQAAAQPPPLELFVDLRVHQLDQLRAQPVLQEAGKPAVDPDLIALGAGVVGNRDLGGTQASSSSTTSYFSTPARSPMVFSPLGGDIEFSVSSPWR